MLAEAREKLASMDPHAKVDILKYQNKLFAIDKKINKILEQKQENGKEYEQAREDYYLSIGKKKALQKTLLHLISEYDSELKKMGTLREVLEVEQMQSLV